jgi:hypothetical protein
MHLHLRLLWILGLLLLNSYECLAVFEKFFNGLLDAAVVHSAPQLTQLALKCGGNINACDEHGYPPIYWAVRLGHMEILRSLTHNGANWSILLPNDQTLLQVACDAQHDKRNAMIAIFICLIVEKFENNAMGEDADKIAFLNAILNLLNNDLYTATLDAGIAYLNEVRTSIGRMQITRENLRRHIEKLQQNLEQKPIVLIKKAN